MSLQEKLQMSGNVAFIGVTVVFLILVLLILVISIFARIMNRPAKDKVLESIEPADEDYRVSEDDESESVSVIKTTQEEGELDPELIAIIVAAITVSMEQGLGFHLRSIRRTGRNTTAWNHSGRNEYLSTRL